MGSVWDLGKGPSAGRKRWERAAFAENLIALFSFAFLALFAASASPEKHMAANVVSRFPAMYSAKSPNGQAAVPP